MPSLLASLPAPSLLRSSLEGADGTWTGKVKRLDVDCDSTSEVLPQFLFAFQTFQNFSELHKTLIFQKLSVDASLTNIIHLHYLHSAVSLCTFAVSKAVASGK